MNHRTGLCALMGLLLSTPTICAAVYRVSPDGSEEFQDIASAVAVSSDRDVIVILPGVYVVNEPIEVPSVTLCGISGPDVTEVHMENPLDPNNASVIRYTEPTDRPPYLVVMGLTITGGRGTRQDDELTHGGAIFAPGVRLRLNDCVIRGNSVTGDGGGVVGGDVEAFGMEFSKNVAGREGGGLFATGSRLTDCVFSRNRALRGGAYRSDGSLSHVGRSVFAENFAAELGGAVYQWQTTGNSSFVNCLLYGNVAGESGGALAIRTGFLSHCTLSNNFAPLHGAVFVPEADINEVAIRSSIVWSNGESSFPDGVHIEFSVLPSAQAQAGVGNLHESPRFESGGRFDFARMEIEVVAGSMISMPSFLLEEPNYRLAEDSPAIDAAQSGLTNRDVAQGLRPCGSAPDMGAFEGGECENSRFLRGDADGNGAVEITDGIFVLNSLMGGSPPSSCAESSDSNNDGSTNITDSIVLFSFLFLGGPPTAAPGPFTCGPDTDDDYQGCAQGSGGCAES